MPCAAASLVLLALLLHGPVVRAAALRQHQPRPPALPGAEMAKALEYIEGLQQQSDAPEHEEEEEEELGPRWGHEAAPRGEDASQQLLKTLLTSLQGASEDPKSAAAATNKDDDNRMTSEAGDYGGYPVPKHGKLQKFPLMFEDEDSRESPYKRTNENAEPQYTPQSLATLQSVFQDLGKLSSSKDYKRQSRGQELYRGEDDDLYPLRNLAYEDAVGVGDWAPVEEKVETEEEIKDSQEEFDRGLDSDEDEDDGDDEDDDEEIYMKRSIQPAKFRGKDDPEDFTKMVDYYLLKVLEKTEESEQKREAEAERRLARPAYDPQAVYQLIQISHKLRVPPEALVEALKSREGRKLKKVLVPQEAADDLERVEKLMQISTYNKDRGPVTRYYSRRVPERLANKLKILQLLGMDTWGSQRAKPLQQRWKPKNTQTRYYTPSGRRGNRMFSDPAMSDKREGEYDDVVDEDKIVAYLAAKMLAQYPKVIKKADLKHSVQAAPKEEPLGAFEQAVLDYFDQLASEKGPPSKRHREPDGKGDSPQTQGLDDETLLRMLEYLNPEPSENEERDIYGKNIGGM